MKYLLFLISLITSITYAQSQQPTAEAYSFLVSGTNVGGALYLGTAGELNGLPLPLSYLDSANYWGNYVCARNHNNCNVIDEFNDQDYTLSPQNSAGGDLQIERINVHNGTDIYDAATWQIAVILGQVRGGFDNPKSQDAYSLVSNQNLLLKEGYDGNASLAKPHANRGVTSHNRFLYNGTEITNPKQAYFFRMVSRSWLATDPFTNSKFSHFIHTRDLPDDNSDYQPGKVSWADWKPITGENAWAFLLGPLQAANLHYREDQGLAYVPFSDLAVQNAIDILPTFAAMQSSTGGIYYVPSGTLGNQGHSIANKHQVSVENNFSLYGGLRVLQNILKNELAHQRSLTKVQKSQIHKALTTINIMINGDNTHTDGLLKFFKTKAWVDGEFIQGGLADNPNSASTWIPNFSPRAVDVNTWGIAALGPKQIDTWFGFGAAYKAWNQVKHWGAYGVGHTLYGVGYSDQDGNGIDNKGLYKQGILSAEWTAGAINATREMQRYYADISSDSTHYAQAQQYARTLQQEAKSMRDNVEKLRLDRFAQSDLVGKPAHYNDLLQSKAKPYLYASKRYMIPFGWYANPLPSTCSTAWMIMIDNHFNPFAAPES